MSNTPPPRTGSPVPGLNKPTAKRSPSILVTDVRSHQVKGARAPFAGQNFKKQQQLQQQQQQQQQQSGYSFEQSQHQNALQKRLAFRNKYTDISVDKLLSNSSDIPSGQSRFPPKLGGKRSRPSSPTPPITSPESRRNIRSIPKLSTSLPTRTSKTSQKLVLIPDQLRQNSPPLSSDSEESLLLQSQQQQPDLSAQILRSRAELMPKEKRAQEFSRVTAYFICEEFNLPAVAKFLRKNHEVKPRLYDEALYVPYALPLLPGSDGLRVKSNNSSKLQAKNKHMEKMINKSEQTDHLYEYYSGVETPEDANNYSMDPELENFDNAPFDPSEPQFFAPPLDSSEEGEQSNVKSIPETNGSHQQSDVSKHHAEMFVFAYGIVVFWNFSEIHEKNILADLAFSDKDLLINPIDEQDIETEEFHFEYDRELHRPRIYNDMITLRSGDHLIKLTMSMAIAQSTKLGLFESRMVNILHSISKLPKKLALTGRLGLKRNQLLRKSGKLFKLRVDVNLSSSILDTPDFFWSFEPALHPLYNAVREYLEIDQRVQVLNDRCKVFLEFSDIVSDKSNEMPLVSIYGPDRQNLSSNDRSNGQQMRSNIQDDLMEIDENLEEINRRFHHNEDSMEVEALPQYEQVSGNVSYLIIDTNFFIQNLQFIDDLYNIADQFKLKLVVPNAVIGELDGLKKNEIKGVSARNAIKWIHKSLSEDKDVMRGQRLSESYDRTLHGDDSILDCSLWYQNTYEISLVVLLTNDKNFVTKARINGIKTFEYSDDYSASEVGSIVLQENIYVFGERTDEYRVQRGHQLKSQQPKVQPQSTKDSFRNLEDKLLNIDQTLTSTERLDTIYNEIVTCLREGIHKALVKEYQESLELLQNYNKMGLMTVDECSRTIIRFWQVFGSYFRRNDLLPFREEGKGRNSKKFPINLNDGRS
ncbi:RMD8 [Candida pseudojiufengensis]|uniref:RMD8 n=1 Tax=Candida pseudojiufengensis TaxID=497109 RepID=UPI002225A0BC|nr:RMD8 [Candida pseudojiufengensis]KAI5960757.1 RMD8 [Candida pseudojiufengensis]